MIFLDILFEPQEFCKKEIKNIRKIEKLNFVGLQNCGHLPHVDLPLLSCKIIQDYFLE